MTNVKFEYNGKLSDGRTWDEDSKKKVTVELDDTDLTVSEMLEEFMNFMQAIGYKFNVGDRFDVVNDFVSSNTESTTSSISEEVSQKPTISKEEIAKEVERLKTSTYGLTDDALEVAAYHNLSKRKE